MTKLQRHLESHLGTVLHVWDQLPGLSEAGVIVAQHDSEEKGCKVILSTLGLSRHPLRSVSSGETIFHELVIFAHRPAEPVNLPSVLAQVVSLTVLNKRALLKGDVLGPAGKLLQGSNMEAFFVTVPILLPREFAAVYEDDGRGIALVWLLPITRTEAIWAKTHGWEAFEEQLDQHPPDVLDWFRAEIPLP